jgi:hypothetical protein
VMPRWDCGYARKEDRNAPLCCATGAPSSLRRCSESRRPARFYSEAERVAEQDSRRFSVNAAF